MDAVTLLRKLIFEHARALYLDARGEPFVAVIDDEDAGTLAAAILADPRFAGIRESTSTS